MPICGHDAALKIQDATLHRVRAARAIVYRGPGVVVQMGLCCCHPFGSVCEGKAVKGKIALTTKGTAVSTLCDESALRCASDGDSQINHLSRGFHTCVRSESANGRSFGEAMRRIVEASGETRAG